MTRMSIAGGAGALVTALLLFAPADAADVRIGVSIGIPVVAPLPPPPVVVAAPPTLAVIPGTPVLYAPALSLNFFMFGGRYYTFHNEGWFSAAAYNAPWVHVPLDQVPHAVLAVPVAYYKVPPGHWKKGGPPPPGAGHGRVKKGKGRDD